MTTQTKTTEKLNDQVTKQLDQMVDLSNTFYAQAEKAMDFWTTQSQEAVKESQKLSKEWMSASKDLGNDCVKAYQAQVKEAFKLFTPAS